MIRKLFVGGSVLAFAAAALLLMTVGTANSAKPAEAQVGSITTIVSAIGVNTFALVQVDAQDEFWDPIPFNSFDDLDITSGGGEFLEFDPTGSPTFWGCTDQGGSPDSLRCRVNSNGFGQSNTFAPNPGSGANTTAVFNDVLSILNAFATGTTHIQVCNVHPQAVPDPATCNNNTSHVEAWWQAPPGLSGGTVTFCAKQANTVCTNLVIVGSVDSLKLFAFRDKEGNGSNETGACKDTPVYVIASANYTFNDFTTFDNNRAWLCVEAKDSNGTPVVGANLVWTTTKGALGTNVTVSGGDVDAGSNILTSGGSAVSGDVATVTVQSNGKTASVMVQFGDDPASCTITATPDPLDVGDNSEVDALFLDASDNWVPDGIIAHLEEVDTGDGDNVEFVSVTEDTVKGEIHGNIIAAISGLVTFAASIEHIAGGDTVCTEAIETSGDIHQHEFDCEDPDGILFGNKPPAAGGFGTFAFCGGTFEQLFKASGCPAPQATSAAAFFYNTPAGGWAVWIPGSAVAAANAEIFAIFPQVHQPIPHGTIFTAKCK